MNQTKIKVLAECAILVALSSVLSLIKIWEMPLGGSITLLSMLPVCTFAYKYGLKKGLLCTLFYAFVQIALDLASVLSWGLTPIALVVCFIVDYILAYGVLGVAGIFSNKGKDGFIAGIAIAMFLRFGFHLISGTVIFDIWAPEGWNPLWYSICYNGTFMLPELILTSIGAVLIFPYLKKHLRKTA